MSVAVVGKKDAQGQGAVAGAQGQGGKNEMPASKENTPAPKPKAVQLVDFKESLSIPVTANGASSLIGKGSVNFAPGELELYEHPRGIEFVAFRQGKESARGVIPDGFIRFWTYR